MIRKFKKIGKFEYFQNLKLDNFKIRGIFKTWKKFKTYKLKNL